MADAEGKKRKLPEWMKRPSSQNGKTIFQYAISFSLFICCPVNKFVLCYLADKEQKLSVDPATLPTV